eukprot:UN21478
MSTKCNNAKYPEVKRNALECFQQNFSKCQLNVIASASKCLHFWTVFDAVF